ncbi:hypothetical protein RHSIM_Rhsim05G0186600 [Rhododendron simsii]|uniref:DUF4378 domain-containing protein n=1 Tax=Rhododendron simsii TaxID=118357 RepID=A0A834GY88_RHOSS|nr:hypothetical protein RHSIM_Rhsim05G0186600 [Rhododendron simsii]
MQSCLSSWNRHTVMLSSNLYSLPGNTQISRQRKLSKLASDSSSYSSGTIEEDLVTYELGRNSSSRVTGTPIKKLLAEEMSKETESKRRSPSVIARLMGLDGLPTQQPPHRQHKGFAETHQKRTTFVASQQDYEHRSSRKNSMEQDKFKDVYEVPETPKAERSGYPAKRIVNSKFSDAEMAFVRQKLVDVKCLSTDEKLRSSKGICDPLDRLDRNKDLLMKFLKQPDSLFAKHLIDLQVDAPNMQCSRIAIIKPSNSHKHESSTIVWKPDNSTLGLDALPYRKHHEVSCRKHHDGTHYSHCGVQETLQSSRIQFDEKNESDILPIRIVVLKPNLEKVQNATKSTSSPCSSHGNLSGCTKNMEYENKIIGKRNLSNDVGMFRPKSRESRERAKEISRRMRESYSGELIDLSSKVKGYSGDESSYCASGSDSGSESEVTVQTSRKSFHWSNRQKPSPSHSIESSLSKEAKKRLSERWKMSRRYQDVGVVGKGGTLGEMLAIPDSDMWPENLDRMTCMDGSSGRFGSTDRVEEWDSPLGISSGDGWKKECKRIPSRSRSVPALSVSSVGPKSSTRCEALDQERYLRSGEARKQSRNKVIDGNSSAKNVSSTRNQRYGKKSHSSRHSSSDSVDSLEEMQFNQCQMETNLGKKDPSEQKPLVTAMPADNVTGKCSISKAEAVAGHKDMTMSSESPDELSPKPSACSLEYNHPATPGPDDSEAQVPQIGPFAEDSVPLQCPLPEPQSPESSKDADHPSPVSVLEAPFTEDISSGSECFERVSADLQELRMQLKLLKMESGSYADVETFTSEKDVCPVFAAVSQENRICNDESLESSYLVDVLIYSQFDDVDPDTFTSKWHYEDCPLGPTLFDNLEQKYRNQTTWSRSDRKLLFDLINSGLVEISKWFVDPHPWVKLALTRKMGSVWGKGGVKRELHEWLASEEERANEQLTERVLDRQMEWIDSGDNVAEIGWEIEKNLIDELISEVAYV